MKQLKISSYFGKSAHDADLKRKRPPDDENSSPGVSSDKSKRKTWNQQKKSKEKCDKENNVRKPDVRGAASKPLGEKRLVLSPKKLTDENVLAVDAVASPPIDRTSPKRVNQEQNSKTSNISRDLTFDFGDLDDLMLDSADVFSEEIADSEEDWTTTIKSELRLDKPVRCHVLKFRIESQPKCEQILLVCAEGSEKKSVCKLRDMWTFLRLNLNDSITVLAEEVGGEWVVNAKSGYIVLDPDTMTSITSLVSGMYCLRKGLLTNLYRGMGSTAKEMLFGQIIHQLLQEALTKKLDTEEGVATALREILKSKTYVRDMYLNDVDFDAGWVEMSKFVAKIVSFVDIYVKGKTPPSGDNFKGAITDVVDIEEVVSSPYMGIHGRVDVTVKVRTRGETRVMPLELKTGRASFSREHRIQVIMYSLLMDGLFRNVDSGLLLYLREGIIQEVKPEFSEIRELLMLRNEFVRYQKEMGEKHLLPDPIRSKSCQQCPFARLCYTHLIGFDGFDSLPSSHPIREFSFPDLKESHVAYFALWLKMLYLETGSLPSAKIIITELRLERSPTESDNGFFHVFRSSNNNVTPIIPAGSTVIISWSGGAELGKIDEMEDDRCTVHCSKKLSSAEKYRIETSERTFLHSYLANLGCLLEPEYERLRELIIDRASPNADDKIPKRVLDNECLTLLKPLNREQQKAVLKAFAAKDYVLIRGPPGTGKTETVVALIKFFHLRNKSILITGHTHSSVDNILLRLDGIEYVRFGSLSSVNEKLHSRCYCRLVEACTSVDEVRRLHEHRVVASTCLGLDVNLLQKRKFDVVLVDESSQVMQVEAVRPLLFGRKFVLVGDSNQLPPVVKSAEAAKLGMSRSIFEHLESDATTVSLRLQYRMNRVLNELANDLTYGGLLQCGSESVAGATLGVRDCGAFTAGWVRSVLSSDPNMSAVFVDTSEHFDRGCAATESTHTSQLEGEIVARLIEELSGAGGVGQERIGVISPFCDQVRLLRRRLPGGVDVSTVDQFQGRDKDVVFFSCAKHCRSRSVTPDSESILNDARRVTVAVTRARVKLIVVGDRKTVVSYAPFNKLINFLGEDRVICLKNGENDFDWNQFIN